MQAMNLVLYRAWDWRSQQIGGVNKNNKYKIVFIIILIYILLCSIYSRSYFSWDIFYFNHTYRKFFLGKYRDSFENI